MSTLPATILHRAQSLPEGGALSPERVPSLRKSGRRRSGIFAAGENQPTHAGRSRHLCLPNFWTIWGPSACTGESHSGVGRSTRRNRCHAWCKRRQRFRSDAASSHSRSISELWSYAKVAIWTRTGHGEAHTSMDAGTGCVSSRGGCAGVGLDGANAH